MATRIRVFTAFSGYDSQCLGLDRLKKKYPEFDYEFVGWSEIDKYAIQAHNAIYPQWADRNYGDIGKINWEDVPDFDLFTYSSPCQDFSNARLQKGGEEGSGTRSSLLWECRRAIVAKKPKFLLMENVAALVSQKFIKTFNKWQEELARYGYTNFAQVLNAKDYGIPQNRERIFLVSVLGEAWYNFPQPFKLEKRLKDVLETNVDEKYYLSDKILKGFMKTSADKSHGHNFTPKDGADGECNIRTAPGSRVDDNFIKEVGRISSSQNSRVINPDGISYAMANGEKDGAPKIVEQCDNLFVANITHVRHFAPNMSSGTGYSEYDILDVYYSNGECEQVKIYTWYESKENIIKDFLIALRYRITPTDKVISLLFEALRGYVPNEYFDTDTTICLNSKVDGKQPSLEHRIYDSSGISTAITTGFHPSVATPKYRIRKLSPRECFRLMDVDEVVIDKIQAAGISNSQQYKLAGNSIVVACLEKIFEQMFFPQYTNSRTLFG